MYPDPEKQASETASSKEALWPPGEERPFESSGKAEVTSPTQNTARREPLATNALPRSTFGLKQAGATNDPVAAAYDYAAKYKPDPTFHEFDEDARIWLMYNDEAHIFDMDMIEEASDSLDILLVFAGLFSAVLTTFIVQTAQSLSPDNAAIQVVLLKELLVLQRAVANGTPINSTSTPVDISAGPSHIDKWVNGLWFTSLALSLCSALLAVLAKQWLRQYRSLNAGTARFRALMRQFRFNAFQTWNVRPIIGFLPTILHTALVLFLIGLVLFLAPLNVVIATVIGFITIILLAIYILTNILAIVLIDCPYRTPLTGIFYRLFSWLPFKSLKEKEMRSVSDWGKFSTGETEALQWLSEATTNPSAKKILHQTLGTLGPDKLDLIAPRATTGMKNKDADLREQRLEKIYQLSMKANLPRISPEKDCTSLTQDEKDGMQRGILGLIHYNDIGGHYRRFKGDNLKFSCSDIGLALVTLAGCGSSRKSISVVIDGEDSRSCPTQISSTEAFSWIVRNHDSVMMPDLPPIVWQRLQVHGNWNVANVRDVSGVTDGLKQSVRESSRAGSVWPAHRPISLGLFLSRQICCLEPNQRRIFFESQPPETLPRTQELLDPDRDTQLVNTLERRDVFDGRGRGDPGYYINPTYDCLGGRSL